MSRPDDDSAPGPEELTRYLNQLGDEKSEGFEALMAFVYGELRAIARAQLRGGDPAQTLQPTVLVHSAYMKLFRDADVDWENRRHFFVVASKAMRQVVIDHSRRRRRQKRGGGARDVTLDEGFAAAAGIDFDLLDLDAALEELGEQDARSARLVELRFFGGLEMEEIARVMGVSVSTIERDWRFARAWLGKRLGEASP